MATWIVHLRVADSIIGKINGVSRDDFIIGNIGPDCGIPNEDWTSYNPPKKVTHWINDHNEICPGTFFDKYLKDVRREEDNNRFSFYLGYYAHLITDVLWNQEIKEPVIELYRNELEKEGKQKFIDKIKCDWYDQDFLYLEEHPQFKVFRCFETLKKYNNNYLPYYSEEAIPLQINNICEFYSKEKDNIHREYKYLGCERRDSFIDKCTEEIIKTFKEKNML